MIQAAIAHVLGTPYSAQDWAIIIGAVTTGLTTCVSAVVAAVVAIRNGRRTAAVHQRVDDVHDCLHRQAAEVKAVVQATPGATETAAAILAGEDQP